MVALLGILQAGTVYVPIDTAAPPARKDTVLDASGARFTVTRSDGGSLHVDTSGRATVTLPEYGHDRIRERSPLLIITADDTQLNWPPNRRAATVDPAETLRYE